MADKTKKTEKADDSIFTSKFGRFMDRHGGKFFWAFVIFIGLKYCNEVVEKDARQRKVIDVSRQDIRYLMKELEVKQAEAWLAAYRDSVYRANFPPEKAR